MGQFENVHAVIGHVACAMMGHLWPLKQAEREGNAHDFTTIARRVVEQTIRAKLDGSPLDNPDEGKNPAADA